MTTCALLCISVAVVVPPAVPQDVEIDDPPVVTDPLPAPGAIVPAGPVVLGARVLDAGDALVRFEVDGQPARGPRVDPDGDLTEQIGVEVTLAPGVHEVSVVAGDHGEVRRWEVVASGLETSVADEPTGALTTRFDPAERRTGPAVLVDLDDPALALAAPPLVAAVDGVVVGVAGDDLTPAEWDRIRLSDGDPIILGGPAAIGEAVVDELAAAGREPVRLTGDGPAELVAAAMAHAAGDDDPGDAFTALVVGPLEPFDRALAAAAAAAELGAALALVGPDEPGPATAALLAGADSLLLSTDLAPAARSAAVDAMGDGAVASDDDLAPRAAQEAVVVADTTDRARAAVAVAAADADRPVLVGSDDAVRWVGAVRPERLTAVVPEAVEASGDPLLDPLLPALATAEALDVDAPAVEAPDLLVDPADRPIVGDVDDLTADLRRAWADGPDAPRVEALIDATGDRVDLTLTASDVVTDATVHVSVLGYEWAGTTDVVGDRVRWVGDDRPTLPLPLEPGGEDSPVPIEITTVTTAGGATRHQRFTSVVGVDPSDTVSAEGWVVAGGSDAQVGEGRLYTYSVEVEPETGLDVDVVEEQVTRILTDPRGWTATGVEGPGDPRGGFAFQRVGIAAGARLRVVVARPSTVDEYCGRVGLRTGGQVSCWDGYRAMLNLDRWNTGVSPFHTDLEVYRAYLVNHELGHGLAHGHEHCTRPGTPAPIMQQQTGGLQGCTANGYPFPDAG